MSLADADPGPVCSIQWSACDWMALLCTAEKTGNIILGLGFEEGLGRGGGGLFGGVGCIGSEALMSDCSSIDKKSESRRNSGGGAIAGLGAAGGFDVSVSILGALRGLDVVFLEPN